MILKYNSPWDPLKTVVLGRTYSESFYNDIKNPRIRDVLQKIARETEEDFDAIEKLLVSLGIVVLRPNIVQQSIMDYIDQNGRLTFVKTGTYALIPKPPMQPRDCQLVVGDKLLATNSDFKMYQTLFDARHISYCTTNKEFDAPLITVIGQNVIVDQENHSWLSKFISQQFPDRNVRPINVGGHNDAVFMPVSPGILISSYHKNCYEDSFPNWKIYHIPKHSWNALPEWRRLKHANQSKWWMPGEESNVEFANFVETWIRHWLGFVAETVFDVNMLVINPNLVLVNNYNKGLFDFFKLHGIQPIISPFRHRFFWDGGIHCITSDLYREGEPQLYS